MIQSQVRVFTDKLITFVKVLPYGFGHRTNIPVFNRTLISFAFLAGLAGQVFAGLQYIDDTGYAVSGYNVVT